MARVIIKEGTKQRIVYRVECPDCGCVYEYNSNDIFREYIEESWPQQHFYATHCPQCSNVVSHSSSSRRE